MASASAGSLRAASAYQAPNSRNGSSASVKSPAVNPFGCCIGADSDIPEYPLVPSSWLRACCYRASLAARLRRPSAAVIAVSLALAGGGCSYQLDSMAGTSTDAGDVTGSVRPRSAAKAAAKLTAELPPEGDLVIARAAVSEVLSKGGKDT